MIERMMGGDVIVRLAVATDAMEVDSLLRSVRGVWQGGWREDCVSRAIEAADGLVFVAELSARVVGFVAAHDLGFRAYLSEIVVAEAVQGRGIGRVLLDRVESVLAERRCKIMVGDIYPNAVGFYTGMGWGKPRSVLMSKEIGENAVDRG